MAGELITRDGQIEYNGLLWGAGTRFPWKDLDGWLEMAAEGSNTDRPVGHGAWAGALHADVKTITLTHRIRAADLGTAVDELEKATKPTEDETPLVVRVHGVARLVWARVIRRAIPMDLAYAVGVVPEAVVQWEATDPRKYSLELLSASTGLPTTGSGFAYPLTYPIDYGTEGSPGQVSCVNTGGDDTPPVLRVAGGCPNPTIVNRRTGRRLAFDLVLTDSDELTVDTRDGTVLLNGVNRAFTLAATSDDPADFLLEPGENSVDFRASGPGGGVLTVEWRHATT